jgi:hypothetical protein
MSRIDSWHWKMSTGHHFQNGHHNTAQIQHCSISTSWNDSRHRKISTGLHFQNGHHNSAKIQHCSISKVAFDLFFKPVVVWPIWETPYSLDYNHILFIFMFADNVAHNLCCQIRADNNSSTCTFATGKSVLLLLSVAIISCLHVLIAHGIFINLGYVDYFQWI